MARNIRRYGYRPNRMHNDTLIHLLRHRRQAEYERELSRGRTVEQQKAAIEPMTDLERLAAYAGRRALNMTPRQKRRRMHKARKHGYLVAA